LQIAQQRGDAGAADAGVVLELPGGAARDRHAEHRQPRSLPRLPRCAEGERLARARLADDDAHSVTSPADVLQHRPLLAGQGGPLRHRLVHRTLVCDSDARVASVTRVLDESLFERQQLWRRVDQLLARDRQPPAIAATERLARVAVGQQDDGAARGQKAIGRGLECPGVDRRPRRQPVAQRLDDVAA
jgi:hypothetical protein